ncbi:MAG: hypothetical protein IJX12_03765 [Lachnospiraceae bacterium]|nr:hypothetical protein [Lachnospiraceae bacterium]
MNSLYKRFVTVGMVSFTSILAWLYCVLEFRHQPMYIAAVSLILVGSVYALLYTAYGLKHAKDTKMEEYINECVNRLVTELNQKDNLELERIGKAAYVQLRKSNALLSKLSEDTERLENENKETISQLSADTQEKISDSVNKAVKLAIKYNQVNNEKLVDSIDQVSQELTNSYKELITAMNKLNLELIELKGDVSKIQATGVIPAGSASLDAFSPEDTTEEMSFTDAMDLTIGDILPESTSDTAETEEATPNLDSFFAEFASSETTEESSDSSTHISTEDLVPNESGMLDQSLIDALLNNLSTESSNVEVAETPIEEETATESNIADVIPFPTADAQPEEPTDPNKPLSADEIAALFASMGTGNSTSEPEPEPEPVAEEPASPVNDDPNRPLSPDEIAALFASMQ